MGRIRSPTPVEDPPLAAPIPRPQAPVPGIPPGLDDGGPSPPAGFVPRLFTAAGAAKMPGLLDRGKRYLQQRIVNGQSRVRGACV